ncbi:MAG: hypothetical protein ACW99G_12900 [Candidatus Thorarchaeota archaeon]|jgi:hypothetical protein
MIDTNMGTEDRKPRVKETPDQRKIRELEAELKKVKNLNSKRCRAISATLGASKSGLPLPKYIISRLERCYGGKDTAK